MIELIVAGVTIAGLVGLIPALIAAYGIVLGAVALVTGWEWFRDRTPFRYRRGGQVPLADPTGPGPGGVR